MEPMKPMPPMQPMQPMQTMQPSTAERWWPEHLGQPSTSGSQNGTRYAFFPEEYVLVIESAGRQTAYDSGNHRISGVAQQSQDRSLKFASQHGSVGLQELKRIEMP